MMIHSYSIDIGAHIYTLTIALTRVLNWSVFNILTFFFAHQHKAAGVKTKQKQRLSVWC